RRRSLTFPAAADGVTADPNTVAAYLDNDLPPEKVAEVEEAAIQSDVNLAEIAACHQVLTLILSEPAKVPPTARQRMYQLVTGNESDPTRKAARVLPATIVPDEREHTEDIDVSPFLSRRSSRNRILAAAVLTVLLGVVLALMMTPARNRPIAENDGKAFADNNAKSTPDEVVQPKE